MKDLIRHALLVVNKSTSKTGVSSTFRVTIPTVFIRAMGLSETTRNVRIEYLVDEQAVRITKKRED